MQNCFLITIKLSVSSTPTWTVYDFQCFHLLFYETMVNMSSFFVVRPACKSCTHREVIDAEL